MGYVCAREVLGASSMLRLICRDVSLVRMLPTLDLSWEKKTERWNRNWSWLSFKKVVGFPMSQQNQNEHKLTVKAARGVSNDRHERSREGRFL